MDGALWKIKDDGSQQYHIGQNATAGAQWTAASPFVLRDSSGAVWVYYMRTDRALWKVEDELAVQLDVVDDDTPGARWGATIVGRDRRDDQPLDEGELARIGRRGWASRDVGAPEGRDYLLGL